MGETKFSICSQIRLKGFLAAALIIFSLLFAARSYAWFGSSWFHAVAYVVESAIYAVEHGIEVAEQEVVSAVNFIAQEDADVIKGIASIMPGPLQNWVDDAINESLDELHSFEKRMEKESLQPFEEWCNSINAVDYFIQNPGDFEEIALNYVANQVSIELGNGKVENENNSLASITRIASITYAALSKYAGNSPEKMTAIIKKHPMIKSILEKRGVEDGFKMILSEVVEPSGPVLEYMNWFKENWYITFDRNHGWINVKENGDPTIRFQIEEAPVYQAGGTTTCYKADFVFGEGANPVGQFHHVLFSGQGPKNIVTPQISFKTWGDSSVSNCYWSHAVGVDEVTGNVLFVLRTAEPDSNYGWTLDYLPFVDNNGKEVRAVLNSKSKKWTIYPRNAAYVSRRINYIHWSGAFWTADLTKNEQFYHSYMGMPSDPSSHYDTRIDYDAWGGIQYSTWRKQYHNNITSLTFLNKKK